jgi:class 3 adenylate cyclase
VNIAARVQATGAGGEPCITDAVRQAESARAQLGEIASEEVMPRGVESPQEIYRYQID